MQDREGGAAPLHLSSVNSKDDSQSGPALGNLAFAPVFSLSTNIVHTQDFFQCLFLTGGCFIDN